MVQFGQLRTRGSPDTPSYRIRPSCPGHSKSEECMESPDERSLPVFYRMKPENISCEASVFPTENRGVFLNQSSDDVLSDCVIVDKSGSPEHNPSV